ncbi:c-type cytochrome [Neisseria animalis]|uniref:Cytochrome C n=1 Tax=Neisseria animalis TaxID=492 RepID=A0A5P3MNJ6_NEIAN|nr:cytochrome c [Neisseria animalis]QEY23116.1 cytochrome C [Neisseria animalis]ROW32523.1 cytochrome C [Neisseria animalis]VEE08168.1 Cytochrome c' [Neisseria animalis]
MNIKTFTLSAAAALLLAACGGSPAQPKGPISEDRTAAFKSMMPEFTTMGKMVKGEEAYEVEKFKQAAAKFAEASKKPFNFFESDPQGNGDALPAIWENADKFKAEEEKFHAAVEKLNTAAQSGVLEDIKAAYGEVGASCKSCHDAYRMPK